MTSEPTLPDIDVIALSMVKSWRNSPYSPPVQVRLAKRVVELLKERKADDKRGEGK